MQNILKTVLSAVLCAAPWTAHASPSCAEPLTGWNFDAPSIPAAGATDFEVFLPGNQVGCATGNYNSFVSPPGAGGVTATYDPAKNQTVLTFSGPQNPADSPAPYHFGFTGFVPGGSGGETLAPLAMEWTYPSTSPFGLGAVGVFFQNLFTGALQYFVLYANTAVPGGPTTGNWFEFPFDGSYNFRFTPSAGAVELSDVGYFVSPTPIPLDQLNATDTPPNAPPFILLPGYPKILPEPAGLALFLTGLIALLSTRRQRTR